MRPSPRSIRASLAVLLAATCLAVAPSARAFELHRHSVMTYQVLTRHGVGGVAAGLIAWGAMLPDVQDCIPHCYCDYAPSFCQPDPTEAMPFASDHFDNNLFDESIYRVNARMAEARGGIVPNPNDSRASAMALVAFGKALHTTQDFYAHSTFVEINIFSFGSFNLANAPLWYGEPYALYSWHHGALSGDGSLQSGFYLQGAPSGGYTHDQLNKDSPGSPEGGQFVSVTGHGSTRLYACVSGDFTGSMNFTDEGLAPRHTLYAYQQLLSGGDVFPYVFGARTPRAAASPASVQAVLDFFSWVEQDSTCQALAVAADSIMAHASGDSIASFDMDQIDADGLPVPPATTGVAPSLVEGQRLLGAPRPNPFLNGVQLDCIAPRAGRVRVAVFDGEGRRIATLLDAEVGAGRHAVAWSGLDAAGRAVPAGVYLVRMSGFGRDESRRVVRMR